MANADGGVIAIGIEDDGSIIGVDTNRENRFRQVPSSFLQMSPSIRIEPLPGTETESVLLFHISLSPNVVIKLLSSYSQVLSDFLQKTSADDEKQRYPVRVPLFFRSLTGSVQNSIVPEYTVSVLPVR